MVYPLKDDAITIGRSGSCGVQVIDKRVSRHHAVIRRAQGAVVLEDLGSKNGTVLNNERLSGRVKLRSGDRITLGDVVLLYEEEPPSGTSKKSNKADTTQTGRRVKLVTGELDMAHEEMRVKTGTDVPAPPPPVKRDYLGDPFERLKVLYQVAESTRSIFNVEELLARIMDILWSVVKPYRGIILLRDASSTSLDPVVVRTDETPAPEIQVSSTILERCVADRVAILISDAPSDIRFSGTESVIASRIRSAICAPIIFKDYVLGVIYIDSRAAGHIYYTTDDLELISGIANQAAVAITNARLHQRSIEQEKMSRELDIARSIQTNLLPKSFPEVPGVTLTGMSLPARQVGGDFYDVMKLDDGRLAIVVADVSGKGLGAALLTSTVRASLRAEIMRADERSVAQIVATTNIHACRDTSNNMFITLFFAIYDPAKRTLDFTNAGHPHPLLYRASGKHQALETGGCFLGIMEQVEYASEQVSVSEGDTLIIYTDGVTDTQNAEDERFGTHRLEDAARANLTLTPSEIRDEIYEATLQHRGDRDQFDDLTIVVAKF